ncbi:hypothetical protein RR48_14048 [Papilio machaon]|uniref:Uncharacterized protein n=1 Tax=Papilio machaon TaxID=76193 RepID=A0A194QLS0_PAPMA|nr:hypothetical protein RR48_14048 [Papilio machaon]
MPKNILAEMGSQVGLTPAVQNRKKKVNELFADGLSAAARRRLWNNLSNLPATEFPTLFTEVQGQR